jgi:hypothetical protein
MERKKVRKEASVGPQSKEASVGPQGRTERKK